MRFPFQRSLCILLFALLIAGCGDSQNSADLGGWTLDTESLTVTEEMTTSGTENYFFGDIGDLAVTSDGRIIVADTDAQHVKVLRPDGTLIAALGREGQGPGEFQSASGVDVSRGDSLYVTDSRANRLSVFGPDSPYDFERVVSATNQSRVSRYLVLGDQFAGRVGGGFNPNSDERPPPHVWRRMSATGTLTDTLLTARRRDMKMTKVGGSFAIGVVPFSRQTLVTSGPDNRIYHAWTDSLHIEATTLDGHSETVASIPAQPIPITRAARDSALAVMDDAGMRSEMSSAMRDTKPALTGLLVAEDGRIWVERPAEVVNPDSTTWWRLLPDEQTIQAVTLPSAVSLQEVHEGTAYGTTETEMGAPAVRRYDVTVER